MQKFIKNPNLPKNQVKACIISEQVEKAMQAELLKLGIDLFFVSGCQDLQKPVSAHADMLSHHAGDRHIFLEQGQKNLYQDLKAKGFLPKFIGEKIQKDYPFDILLNTCLVKNKVFCNTKHTSQDILSFYQSKNFDIINIKQGYAKCSCLILNENAIITDDEGLYLACQSNNIDALLIKKGGIVLKGYPYGFIGGCGGLIGKDKLALFGDYKTHFNANEIKSFTQKHKIDIISLGQGHLRDYGSLLPILEL